MCFLGKLFTGTIERPSPSDIVPQDSIGVVATDKLSIGIDLTRLNIPFTIPPRVWVPPIPDTNSMDPSFDSDHNNILIAGADESEQKIMLDFVKAGDIAAYRVMENPADNPGDFSKPHKFWAIHRIMKIDKDDAGRYFRFKGDNNATYDPYKVRDAEILWLSIGVIY